MAKRAPKGRNPIAASLRLPTYRPKVVQSKKQKLAHRRKAKHPAKSYGDVSLCA